MNMCCFVGRIATDLEIKESNNVSYLRFRVAVRRPVSRKEGEPDADFVPCVAFNKTAEFIHRNFKKGDYISLITTYRTDKYTTPDGTSRTTHDFYVEHAEFCSPRQSRQEGEELPPSPAPRPTVVNTKQQNAPASSSTVADFGIELPF